MASFVLTARLARDEVLPDGQLPSLLRYDRGRHDANGYWRYYFVGVTPMHPINPSVTPKSHE